METTRARRAVSMALAAVTLVGVVGAADVHASSASVAPSLDRAVLDRLVTDYNRQVYPRVGSFEGERNEVLPSRLEQGFRLGDVRVFAGLSDGSPQARGGIVDYGETRAGYQVIAASDGPSMDRFALVLKDRSQEHFALAVQLPADAQVVNEATGAVTIKAPGRQATTLAPASAVDAAGESVPANYRIVGDRLVVDVDLDRAAMPVLVDPVSANYWWGHRDWYSRADVRWQADWWGVVRVVQRVCGGNGVCLALVNAYVGWVFNTWQYAKNNNMCLSMDQMWTGQITNIYAYRCNWG
jgi:hypothetical protein